MEGQLKRVRGEEIIKFSYDSYFNIITSILLSILLSLLLFIKSFIH